jgi:Peptidase M66
MRGVKRPRVGAASWRRTGFWTVFAGCLALGCSSEPPANNPSMTPRLCVPGIQTACPCSTGQGVQVCDASGGSFGQCQCPAGAMALPVGGAAGGAIVPRAGATASAMAGQPAPGGSVAAAGSSGGSAGGTAGTTAGTMAPAATGLAGGIRISELAIYQAVKVSLAVDGEAVIARNAPVIVGKEAFLRVSVEPQMGFTARDIEVELTLSSKEATVESQRKTQRITAASSDAMLQSTVNFEIPGGAITEDLRYAVALHEVGGGAPSGTVDPAARFPTATEELEELGPRDAGPLRIKVIPYRYGGDGSNRLPAMDQAQLDLFEQFMHAYYPAQQIEISIHEPVDYTAQVGPNTGWEEWLDFHCNLRMEEDPDPKVLYYGVLSPRESLRAYGGGIIGISPVPNAAGNYGRCSVGVGWAGNIAASTMAHELGHSLGLPHAPCGTSGGPFPYAEAKIGVWGYSLQNKMLRDPDEYYDMMSYCDPSFISDYNFEKLFERIRYLNLQFRELLPDEPARYTRVLVDRHGQLSVRGQIDMVRAPGGDDDLRDVRLLDREGRDLGVFPAYYFPFSEAPAGTWLIPDGPAAAHAAAIEGFGTVVLP